MADDWNSPQKDITPEDVVLNRRKWLRRAGLATAGLVTAGGIGAGVWWHYFGGTDNAVLQAGRIGPLPETDWDPNSIYPLERPRQFAQVDRPITEEPVAARYCNFYEFASTKNVWRYVSDFQPHPWTIRIDGEVEEPKTLDVTSLIRHFAGSHEERVYRHRCVETWAMVVPWDGFPLADLIRWVRPKTTARYVRFESFERPEEAGHQGRTANRFPWPYTEGLTMGEATNPLTFIATGMYGHPLLKQHGAPLRLVVPWKYGFKSIKSITRIEFTRMQPTTFWNTLIPNEYGFQANVNPQVPHPRWSQARERMLGTDEPYDTQLYNGYGRWVADLY